MKIIKSRYGSYNSKMLMTLNRLKSMFENSMEDREFINFIWDHISNNPNLKVEEILPDNNSVIFVYRFLQDKSVYRQQLSYNQIGSMIKKKCGYFDYKK